MAEASFLRSGSANHVFRTSALIVIISSYSAAYFAGRGLLGVAASTRPFDLLQGEIESYGHPPSGRSPRCGVFQSLQPPRENPSRHRLPHATPHRRTSSSTGRSSRPELVGAQRVPPKPRIVTLSSRSRDASLLCPASEIPCVIGAAGALVHRHLWIGAQRSRHVHAVVRHVRSNHLIGSCAQFPPPLDRRESIELVRARTAAAMRHARHHEEA